MSGKQRSDYLAMAVRNFLQWLRQDKSRPRVSRRVGEEYISYLAKLEGGRPTAEAYVEAAQEKYGDEGRIEVDDIAVVSQAPRRETGDGAKGAYVMAWVWVYDRDVKSKAAIASKRSTSK